MPELIPAEPGTPDQPILTITYREPFRVERWPVAPGSFLEVAPVAGQVVDRIRVSVPAVADA